MSEEWRWIPVSELPTGKDRELGMLFKDGIKGRGWFWPGSSRFGEDVTHWCEMRYPLLPEPPEPEPEKPLIQRVCEGLGVEKPCVFFKAWWASMQKNVQTDGEDDPMLDALLWRIEEALVSRGDVVLEWEHEEHEEQQSDAPECWLATYRIHYGKSKTVWAATRGEALLKAALWLMEREGSDGR